MGESLIQPCAHCRRYRQKKTEPRLSREWRGVTGGSNGLMGIPLPEVAGLDPAAAGTELAGAYSVGNVKTPTY